MPNLTRFNSNQPAVDQDDLLHRIDYDADLLASLNKLFDIEWTAHLGALKLSQQTNNTQGCKKALHTLRGMALNMSAKPLSLLIETIEHHDNTLKNEGPLGADAIDAIELEAQRLQAELIKIQQTLAKN